MPCGRKLGPYDCCSVVQGDCLELMKALPDGCVDAVITDPPYGVDAASWDSLPPVRFVFTEFLRVSHGMVLAFSGASMRSVPAFVDAGPDRLLLWAPSFTTSCLMTNGLQWRFHPIWAWRLPPKSATLTWDIITDPTESRMMGFFHPAMKPERVMRKLVGIDSAAETILDPFLGSGTTAVAAKKLGRHFLGFEISETYVKIARERIALVEAQPSLFEQKPEQLELTQAVEALREVSDAQSRGTGGIPLQDCSEHEPAANLQSIELEKYGESR